MENIKRFFEKYPNYHSDEEIARLQKLYTFLSNKDEDFIEYTELLDSMFRYALLEYKKSIIRKYAVAIDKVLV